MPYGLKMPLSKFQKIINEIFNLYTHFGIVYIDNALIFSQNIAQYWKHLKNFENIMKKML